MFNRNKKSLALDLQGPRGREAVLRLIATADIFSENFKPGTMEAGLDYASLKQAEPAPDLRQPQGLSCPAPTTTAPRWTKWCR
jgi:hypothetical protein